MDGEHVTAIHRAGSNKSIVRKVIGYSAVNATELYDRIEWIECDVCDFDRLVSAMKGSKVVYHCAGLVSFGKGQEESILKTNVQGTANIVKACLENHVEQLCHVSSNSALRISDKDTVVDESGKWEDNISHPPYWTSKHLAEEEVYKGIASGLSAVIVNPTIIIGPGNWEHSSSSFFPAIGKGMLFYTEGITGYVDVNDVVRAMIILTGKRITGERFLINSENLSYRQIFTMIAGSLGVRKPVFRVPEAFSFIIMPALKIYRFITGRNSPLTGDILKAAWAKVNFDNRKIIKETGISFIPVKKSIEATAAAYLSEKSGPAEVKVG